MSDTTFQKEVLEALHNINGRFDTLEGRFDTLEGRFDTLEWKVDSLASELHEFKENQEQYNQHMEQKTDALWLLSNQAFTAISDVQKKSSDIHQEVIAPWKRRQSSAASL